ncbi:retrovirus-related pol polyprotein from transposon TNT 1-94 [Tanacetum coccineum]
MMLHHHQLMLLKLPRNIYLNNFLLLKNAFTLPDVPNVSIMDDNTRIFAGTYDDEDVGGQADLKNLETTMNVNSIPTTRLNKDHPIELIIGDLHSAPLTRRMSQQNLKEHCLVSYINKQRRTNHKEPKKVIQALEDPSWIEAMQEELLQFELPRAIGTKWVFKNKKDERGIVVRNKARLVAKGYTQEEGIDYDKVFEPIARIKAIRLFFAYASYMWFIMYQMDVKSAFLYGTIEEEVYVYQPPGFEDPHFLDKVYKVEKALYGLHQAPRAWYETLSTYLLENRFRRGTIDKTLFIKKDKYDAQEILDEFYGGAHPLLSSATSTPMEPNKALVKDEEVENVDVHLYRSMIGSFMYLTASRPDITFAVCACARDSSFDLEAFSDSDYAGASLDRKSTTGDETVYKEWEDRMERAATTASSLEAEQDSEAQSRFEAASKQSNDPPLSRVNTLGNGEDNMKLMELIEHYTTLSELFWATAKVKMVNGERQLQALVDKKKVIITETSIRSDLNLEDAGGTDCLPTATIFEELAKMGKQRKDSAPTKPTTEETTPEENVATPSCDPPQSGEDRMKLIELMNLCTQLQSRVLALETTKSNQALVIEILKRRVKNLEKRRKSRTPGFKRLRKVGSASRVESSNNASLGAQEDASKQGRKIDDLDVGAEVTLVDETQEMNDDNLMFDTDVLEEQEKDVAEKEVSVVDPVTTAGEVVTTANVEVTTVNAPTTTINELTLAQTLIEIKAAKPKAVTSAATTTTTTRPKARGVVVQEPSEFKTTSSSLKASQLL